MLGVLLTPGKWPEPIPNEKETVHTGGWFTLLLMYQWLPGIQEQE
jgi:hypothetical protein